jgi:tripartite-type tricarboxylate transporter receptor subunit TctC
MLVALAVSLGVSNAAAQAFPSKPVFLIVPFPGGSTSDTNMRVIGAAMEPSLGQKVIVEPKPGAGGAVGTQYVIAQPPDGHTILMTSNSITIKSALPKPPFDARKDVAPIGLLNTSPLALAVRTEFPFRTAKELVDYAKANPGKLNMASLGVGSIAHLWGELLMHQHGAKAVHIPYQGSVAASLSLAQGNADFAFEVPSSLKPHVDAGKVRILAVSSAARDPQLPDMPGMAESGISGFDATGWVGFVAPAGTPRDVIARLNAAFSEAVRNKSVIEHFAKVRIALLPKFGTPEQFATVLARDTQDFQRLIRETKLQVE